MVKKPRDGAIELYRAFLMFGICLVHACGNTGEPSSVYLDRMLRACVPGFVFISGWFGMRFSLKKLGGLYATAAYASGVAVLFGWLVLGRVPTLKFYWDIVRGFWFLNAYALLMLFVPLLNQALDGLAKKYGDPEDKPFALLTDPGMSVLWPILGMTFGWCFLQQTGGVARILPKTAGVANYSGLMMVGVYVAGRLSRFCRWDEIFGTRFLLICFLSALGMTSLGCGFETYSSPFALVSSASLFLLVKRFPVAQLVGQKLLWLAPSLFSVYLLHAQKEIGFRIVQLFKRKLVDCGCSDFAVMLLAAAVLFTVCLLLDMPRRGGVMLFRKIRLRKTTSCCFVGNKAAIHVFL